MVHWLYFVTCNTATNVITKMICTCDNCPATKIKYCVKSSRLEHASWQSCSSSYMCQRIGILLTCGNIVHIRMVLLRWERFAHKTSLEPVIFYCSVYTSLGQESEQSSLCVRGSEFAAVSTIIYWILELFRQCRMFWFPFYYPYQELIRIAPYRHAIWYLFKWAFVDILRNILKVCIAF